MPNDFGPLYLETDMSRLPVEPWNTFSNLIFLGIFFYWAYKTRFDFKRQRLLSWSLPILFVGYVGGTLYHATRSHPIWLILDFVPILLLCLMVSYTYWFKILGKHRQVLAFVIGPFLVIRSGLGLFPLSKNAGVSIGYGLLGTLVLAPLFAFSFRAFPKTTRPLKLASAATGFLLLAIAFRMADMGMAETLKGSLPMGTHWLWHLLGGCATFCAMQFVYETDAGFPKPGR